MVKVLLVGPYDPFKGELSFNAPPLGIWRICGFLRNYGIECNVFDPNLYTDPYNDLALTINAFKPMIIGFSITSCTLPYDLSLIHFAKLKFSDAIYIGGGIGATFEYSAVLNNSPLDFCVMGEGEIPLLNICNSIEKKKYVDKTIPGLIFNESGKFFTNPTSPLNYQDFRTATFCIPYNEIPFNFYWEKIRNINQINNFTDKEKYNRDIYSIRLMTSNYCPMKCAFCSYTNFLNFANNGKKAKLVRLTSDDIIKMITKITKLYPSIKTLIFQDDIFILKDEKRGLDIFEDIIRHKQKKLIPEDLTFIASCRIDFLDEKNLELMKEAGFRLIGYGVESFSKNILNEYLKEKIYGSIEKTLNDSLKAGIKPFIDIILASPNCTFNDVISTLKKCIEYLEKDCEFSIYPTVIPFAGSKMTQDKKLMNLITYQYTNIYGTQKGLLRGTSIQPREKKLQKFLLKVNDGMKQNIDYYTKQYNIKHLPSRLRSLIYVLSAIEVYPALFENSKEIINDKILSMVAKKC